MITTALTDDNTSARLRTLAGQIPTIAVNALNRTAFLIRKAEQDSMRAVFDRPTPWILNSIWVTPATLENQTAIISISDYLGNAEQVIAPHIYGGTRPEKTVEKRMVRTGLLPAGWYIMPASGMPLDVYGNPVSGELIKMLSWLGALEIGNRNPANKRRNKTQQQNAAYFLSYPGRGSKLPPGIYKRVGNQTLMMLYFTPKADYQKRFPFFETAQKVIDDTFEVKLRSEIYQAMGI